MPYGKPEKQTPEDQHTNIPKATVGRSTRRNALSTKHGKDGLRAVDNALFHRAGTERRQDDAV